MRIRKYVIDEEAYATRLRKDKMITGTESRADLGSKGYEFMYSFYRNEIIEYEKNGIVKKERFWSRTMDAKSNYIETKPIEKSVFDKRNIVSLSKSKSIKKIRKDILGKEYVCSKEKFSSECW